MAYSIDTNVLLRSVDPNDPMYNYDEWERLVIQYQVKGVNVHDARLTAAMLVHGITHILTFNIEDFNRYAGEITPVHPTSVIHP